MNSTDYELLAPVTEHHAQIRFGGRFAGQKVQWQASILTLRHYQRIHAPTACELRPFIHIESVDCTTQEGIVTVALDVTCIDHATLLKTIIMLRQYKRLQLGRHEFGQTRRFFTTQDRDSSPT